MKRALSILIVMILFLQVLPAGQLVHAVGFRMGDVNGDAVVNMGDVSKLFSCVSGKSLLMGAYAYVGADVNGDDKLNMGDVSKVYSHIKRGTPLGSTEEADKLVLPEKRYIVNIGDSIFGRYQAAKEYMSISYKLAEKLGCTAVIGAFSGTQLMPKSSSYAGHFSGLSITQAIVTGDWSAIDAALELVDPAQAPYFAPTVERLKAVDFSKVTDITICYGTTDWNGNTSVYNYKKSLRSVIDSLQGAFPHIEIHVVSAINRFFKDENGNVTVDAATKKNTNGKKLGDFVRAAQEVALEKNVNFINLFDTTGFDFSTRVQYYGSNLTHPNSAGNDVLCEIIAKAMFYGGKVYDPEPPKTTHKPSFGWIDDDGKAKLEYLYEWAVANEVPVTSAVISGKINVGSSWLASERMAEMYRSGFVRFASHTQNHVKLSKADPATVEAELSGSKTQIEGFGVPCDFLVYPTGAINSSDLSLVEAYYPFAFAAGGTYDQSNIPNGDRVNYDTIDRYRIKRVDIRGDYTEKNGGLDYLKEQIDDAIYNNGMLIFMSHIGSTKGADGTYLAPEKDLEVYTWAVNYIRQCGYDIEPAITVCQRFADRMQNG